MPRLEIITGEQAQHQFLVEKVGVWIGSDERCDLRLEEPGISRFHAQIIRDPKGDYWLEDAGSSFGTLLNGNDVERELLNDQDVLTLGRVKLRFLADEPAGFEVPRERELSTQPHRGLSNPPGLLQDQSLAAPAFLFDEEPPTQPPTSQPFLSPREIMASQEALATPSSSPSMPFVDDDDDEEILDGDELELIEESEYDLEGISPAEASMTPDGNILPAVPNPFLQDSKEISYPHPIQPHPSTPTQNEMTQSADLASLVSASAPDLHSEPIVPNEDEYSDDVYEVSHASEGTQLAPIPLSPEEFLRRANINREPSETPPSPTHLPTAPPSNPFVTQGDDDEDDVVVHSEGTQLSRMPVAPPDYKTKYEVESVSEDHSLPHGELQPSFVPPPTPPSVLTELPSTTLEPEDDDLEADLMGERPPPRSRTVMFNLELEKLKHQLLEREKQLNALKDEVVDRNQDFQQNEWLHKTLEMVQEDNKRLQYQITAYEEAAEENEQLIQQVEHLLKENKQYSLYNQQLAEENQQLRETLAQYEQYFYQHQQGGGS